MACVEAVDACQALVVASLRRHGLYDSTLILYLADHGELLGARGPSSFSKYNLYERAIRIPLIVKPPAALRGFAPGTVDDRPVSSIDLLPTVLGMAGLPIPEQLPGIGLHDAFAGRPQERSRTVALTQLGRHLAVRSRRWKLIRGRHGDELYDLAADPHELRDLARDPAAAGAAAELAGELAAEIGGATEGQSRAATQRCERRAWSIFQE
jgi:choline-sulfatase